MKSSIPSVCALLALFCACASTPSSEAVATERALRQEGARARAPLPAAQAGTTGAGAQRPLPGGAWTEAEALAIAAETRPEFAAARARISAAGARVRAAGRLPNPTLYALAEALPLESSRNETEEYVLGLSQPLALGGRVARAEEVAERELEAAAADALAVALQLRREVRGAFATALYAARASELAARAVELASEELAFARVRLEAGEAVIAESTRFELAWARALTEARRAAALDERARAELATSIGLPALEIGAVAGELESTLALPELAELLARLDADPELMAAAARTDAARARVELAGARRVPDLRLDLAYRRIRGVDLNTFDLGLAIDLAVFDSGRAQVAGSRAELAVAQAEEQRSRLSRESELRNAHLTALQALELLRFTEDELIPRSARWARTVRDRFELGDISRAELLQARRAELEVELAALEARRELLAAWARLASYLELEQRPAQIKMSS